MSEDERAEWLAGMKGAYNYIDLNRVGAAVEYITTRLNAAGYSVKTAPKQGWTLGAIPTSAEMSGYLGDVRALRDAVFDALPGTTPELPSSMERLDWRGANAIEQVLLDVNAVIDRINARMRICRRVLRGRNKRIKRKGAHMKDRISAYPGRVKLTPVSGQTNIYDLERADQPTVEGTALNKANLLSDTAAAQVWGDSVPADRRPPMRLRCLRPNTRTIHIWTCRTTTRTTQTLSSNSVYAHCTMQGFNLSYTIAVTLPATQTESGELIVDDVATPTTITVSGVTIVDVQGAGTYSMGRISLKNMGTIHAATSIRFVPGNAVNKFYAIITPIFAASGELSSEFIGQPTIYTSGTSLALADRDYAFNVSSGNYTITSLPSSGVSNRLIFYSMAFDTAQAMSAGATIKLTNSSGKAIQLTNTSNMTYSGNVLSITCNSFRDENAVGIIIQF